MRIKTIIAVFLTPYFLVACATASPSVPSTDTLISTLMATLTVMPRPTPTAFTSFRPTSNPTPISQLIVLASDTKGPMDKGNSDLYRINLDGTGLTQLTFDEVQEEAPAWSPDGLKLLYEVWSDGGGNTQIWKMDWDGSNRVQLTNVGDNRNPSWSPDGTHVLFNSNRNGNLDIFQTDLNGENQTTLTTNPAHEFYAAWSPDGSMLAYLSEQDATQEECANSSRACPQEIFFLDANGVFLGKAAGLKEYITSIDWSPDSQYLAVIIQKDESDELLFYDIHSQTLTPFVDLPGRLESIYNTGSRMFRLWSFSFSPGGYNGVFCATEYSPSTEYRGCYLVGLDGEWLFTLVRGGDTKYFSDAVWQP